MFDDFVAKFKKWYNNFPDESIEVTETTYKHVKVDENQKMYTKEMWLFEELKQKPINPPGLILNFASAYVQYHFFDIDEEYESGEALRKIILWKLKNKLGEIRESDINFDSISLSGNKHLVFSIDRDVIEGLKFYLPDEKEYIVNTDIIGIYNYYVWQFNSKKIKKIKNAVLINMGETITDLIFIENNELKFIRSFKIGVLDYIKKITKNTENLIDGIQYWISNTYIPNNFDELMDSEKLNNFYKIKDINMEWMNGIDTAIRFYIKEERKSEFEIFMMRYENYLENLDFVLSNYIGMNVNKSNVPKSEIPYISMFGNIIRTEGNEK